MVIKKVGAFFESLDRPVQCTRQALVEQILWLIRLRWIAVAGMVTAAVVASRIFPVLESAVPIYICAVLLFLSNIFYYLKATKKSSDAGPKDVVLGMMQIEIDLTILTAVLHFSGGVVNPFFLFYFFHVIIAAIILPRNLSFAVGLTTVLLFGFLAIIKLNGWTWFGSYPLQLSANDGLWLNPVYTLGGFSAFSFSVILAQHLTRMVIVRMTEKELEAARNNDVLEAIISAMGEGLIFVSKDGEVAICNPAAERWKKDGGQDSAEHLFEDFPEVLTERLKNLFAKSDKPICVEQLVEFDTEGTDHRNIEARSRSVIDIDGQELGYVIVGQDLTEHKKLEDDLREQTEKVTAINEMLKMSRVKMAQREKMVAIGQMASGIAHEIGNPLASLSSVVQYLARKLDGPEEKEHLSVISHQVRRISAILKRMLSLSRPVTIEYKWTDINALIENTLSLVKFDKRMKIIKIEDIANSDLPMVWFNPQLFEQVLLNVFINALDAMNVRESETENILKITRELLDGMIEIRISDTGVGMSPEVCKRAFESFFTTKDIGKGTGLGLYISYNLLAEIDGTIEMVSELEVGTTVIIRIPVRPKKNLVSGNGNEPEVDAEANATNEKE